MLSKPTTVLIGTSITCAIYAIWYRQRSNNLSLQSSNTQDAIQQASPKPKIVKTKQELLAYVNSIPLAESTNVEILQKYQIEQIALGEMYIFQKQIDKGCAHIAMGISYLDKFRIRMVLKQLAEDYTQEIIYKVAVYLNGSFDRCQNHIKETMKEAKQQKDANSKYSTPFTDTNVSRTDSTSTITSGVTDDKQDLDYTSDGSTYSISSLDSNIDEKLPESEISTCKDAVHLY